jgi:hypothetical protein
LNTRKANVGLVDFSGLGLTGLMHQSAKDDEKLLYVSTGQKVAGNPITSGRF